MSIKFLTGDCRDVLAQLEPESMHCVVTSPPYFGLRDYGTAKWEGGDPGCDHSTPRSRGDDIRPGDIQGNSAGSRPNTQHKCKCGARHIDSQIGLEPSLHDYIENMRIVFAEVRRVLRADGTLWLNLGDSYATSPAGNKSNTSKDSSGLPNSRENLEMRRAAQSTKKGYDELKQKDLCGIPWRVAFALQADGWYLRSDIIWSKPNPMPESITDRPTKAHEYLFLLAKSTKYFYDAETIKEEAVRADEQDGVRSRTNGIGPGYDGNRTRKGLERGIVTGGVRNRRSVWEIATAPFAEAHFATFPPALIEPCILAGCPEKCCAKCGAPWVREVEREKPDDYGRGSSQKNKGQIGQQQRDALGPQGNGMGVKPTFTTGWYPSCRCDGLPELPAYSPNPPKEAPEEEHTAWREKCGRIAYQRTELCKKAAPIPVISGTVLDPFGGAGTTGLVADRLGRNAILIELNPKYTKMSERRIKSSKVDVIERKRAALNPDSPVQEVLFK